MLNNQIYIFTDSTCGHPSMLYFNDQY